MAKDMAERHIPMTMEDWAKRIDKFLDATEKFCKTQDTLLPSMQRNMPKASLRNIE